MFGQWSKFREITGRKVIVRNMKKNQHLHCLKTAVSKINFNKRFKTSVLLTNVLPFIKYLCTQSI